MSAPLQAEAPSMDEGPRKHNMFIPSQVDYKQRDAFESFYKMIERPATDGKQAPTINLNATTETVFRLCTVPENLHRSTVDFDITVPSQGAGKFSVLHTDAPPIDSIVLRQVGGNELVRINEFSDFWTGVCVANKPLDEYRNNGPVGIASHAADSISIARTLGTCKFMNPSHTLHTVACAAATDAIDAGLKGGCNAQAEISAAASDSFVAWGRRDYDCRQLYAAGAAATITSMHCSIELKDIAESLFGLDQNLYAVEGLELVINWTAGANWGFSCAGATPDLFTDTPLAFTVVPTVSNLLMRVAQEQSLRAINSVVDLVKNRGGLQILVPHPVVKKYDLTAQAAAALQLSINAGSGRNLLRIYTQEKNSTETASLRRNYYPTIANGTAFKVSQFRTSLDGQDLEHRTVLANEYDNYTLMLPLVKNSPLGLSLQDYKICPIYCNDFSGVDSLSNTRWYNKYDCGIKLHNGETLYNKDYLVKAAANHHCVVTFVTQRMFHSGPMGVAMTV